MGLPRSTYYDTPATEADTEIVARITAICEEFEAYGYRRVGAELRHHNIVPRFISWIVPDFLADGQGRRVVWRMVV